MTQRGFLKLPQCFFQLHDSSQRQCRRSWEFASTLVEVCPMMMVGCKGKTILQKVKDVPHGQLPHPSVFVVDATVAKNA
jgi:hypothetical protein